MMLPAQMPQDTFSTHLKVCYEVLLYLNSRLAKLHSGDVLEFVSDDPNAVDEIANWCDLRGYSLLSVDALPTAQWRFLIRK